jgi:abequosyltransferase
LFKVPEKAKKNAMIKLTIAISTYNRSNYLVECLNSILPEITNEVNILVSDNASTDDTEEIMHKFLDYSFVRYYRKETNTGMDGNFLNCLTKADGSYIHLMSDDDIMLPGTVNAIIECINIDNPDFIHLNLCGFTGSYRGVANCSGTRYDLATNFVTNDKEAFLKKMGIYLTYLSSLVLRKELVDLIENPKQFIGTFFLQSHFALLTTRGDKKLVILKHNSIASRGGNTGGYNLLKIWVTEYKKLLFGTAITSGYSNKCVKDLYLNSIKSEVKGFILSSRLSNNNFHLEKKGIIFKDTFMYFNAWIYLYPAAFLPVSILKLLLNIKGRLSFS